MAQKAFLKTVAAPARLSGTLSVPGDKSISHRALMLSSIASGISTADNLAPGKDCLSTLRCMRELGVAIRKIRENPLQVIVTGIGSSGLSEAKNVLNAGNSGTTTRLLSGILVAQPFLSIITGDRSLRSRPMRRLIEPLRLMGADIHGRNADTLAPLVIKGKQLHGIHYSMKVASAQIKSALLLAGLYADSDTIIEEKPPSRDHTERLLTLMGVQIKTDGASVTLKPLSHPMHCIDINVPGDFSSAAFWLVAGAIHPNAIITVTGCGINPTRTGLIDILLAMGARLTIKNKRSIGNEPVADLHIESSELRAVEINGDIIPRLIDEIPALAVAACAAKGKTIIHDAGELRVKESDRLMTTARELSRLGAQIDELPDGMVIHGGSKLVGTLVESHDDHRLAMSLAIAGLIAQGTTGISGARAVAISYPDFWKHLETLSGKA